MQKLTVKTSRPYDVYIGRGAMKFLEDHWRNRVFAAKFWSLPTKQYSIYISTL